MSSCIVFNKLFLLRNSLKSSKISAIKEALKIRPSLCFSPSKKNEFHTSCQKLDLMEFFEDKENWGQSEVKVGREWKVEELRIKSNSDLHKLWYVLLKEKNMLLTMQHEYNQQFVAWPSPERLDKVEMSMENIEVVVKERNKAYYELEIGHSEDRDTLQETNCFGLPYEYKPTEHVVKREDNKEFLAEYELNNVTHDHEYVKDFLMKLDEKKRKREKYEALTEYKEVCEILKRFPHVDEEALKERYPKADIEKAKKDPKSRTHGINKY